MLPCPLFWVHGLLQLLRHFFHTWKMGRSIVHNQQAPKGQIIFLKIFIDNQPLKISHVTQSLLFALSNIGSLLLHTLLCLKASRFSEWYTIRGQILQSPLALAHNKCNPVLHWFVAGQWFLLVYVCTSWSSFIFFFPKKSPFSSQLKTW